MARGADCQRMPPAACELHDMMRRSARDRLWEGRILMLCQAQLSKLRPHAGSEMLYHTSIYECADLLEFSVVSAGKYHNQGCVKGGSSCFAKLSCPKCTHMLGRRCNVIRLFLNVQNIMM